MVQAVVGIPMKREKVELDPREANECYDRLRGELARIPSAMLFNLDETGHDDRADRKHRRTVVPV
jgi:hypothetical protein